LFVFLLTGLGTSYERPTLKFRNVSWIVFPALTDVSSSLS
jgi:hypothetical protein